MVFLVIASPMKTAVITTLVVSMLNSISLAMYSNVMFNGKLIMVPITVSIVDSQTGDNLLLNIFLNMLLNSHTICCGNHRLFNKLFL